MFSNSNNPKTSEKFSENIDTIKQLIQNSDAVVLGGGSGLSSAAGLLYSGERFELLFSDYIKRYNLTDMYTAAFYNHKTPEQHWGYWSRHIYHNRYNAKLNSTYQNLFNIIKQKNYFVLTTNGDHLFLLNGFEKERVFYTQGDYGLFQCSKPCHQTTYQNKDIIFEMVEKQTNLEVPTELLPRCPRCGRDMKVNLRMDKTFAEPDGWFEASKRYENFLKQNIDKKILFLELGVGYNTPGIIKIPFWQMTHQNKNAWYVCLNLDRIDCPNEISNRSVCIKGDIYGIVKQLSL